MSFIDCLVRLTSGLVEVQLGMEKDQAPRSSPPGEPTLTPRQTEIIRNSDPIACSLAPNDLQTRLREWSDLRKAALIAERTEGNVNTTIWVRRGDVATQLRRLVDAERQCCSFLGFDLQEIEDEIRLATTFPPGGR